MKNSGKTQREKPDGCPFCGNPFPCLNHGSGHQH